MEEDFSEIINKFSNILKEKNINLNSNSGDEENSSSPISQPSDDFDIDTILKIKDIMSKINANQNCPRNQLLKALKPYLENTKQEKLDQYIKIANIISILDNLEFGSSFLSNKKGYDLILIITLILLIF